MRLWVIGFLVLATVIGWEGQAQAAILINEILADPAGDADGDGVVHATKDEFVELINTGSEPFSLEGWTLSDALQVRRTFDAASVIPARGFWVAFGGLALNNTGDTVSLHDAASLLVDAYTFGAEGGQDTSLTRSPDGEGAFVLHNSMGGLFSPGYTVLGATTLPLLPPPQPGPLPDPQPELPSPDEDDAGLPGSPVVPEPSSLLLLSAGLAWFRYNGRRNEKGAHHSCGIGGAGCRGSGGVHCHI